MIRAGVATDVLVEAFVLAKHRVATSNGISSPTCKPSRIFRFLLFTLSAFFHLFLINLHFNVELNKVNASTLTLDYFLFQVREIPQRSRDA